MTLHLTRRAALAGLALCLAGAVPAAADTYPSKPIRFVVPFAAGSATDTLARVLGQNVSAQVGQPVVVENVPAPTARSPRARWPARRPMATRCSSPPTPPCGQPVAGEEALLRPCEGLRAHHRLGTITLALVVNPQVPAKTTQELIAYAKANPGKLTFGAGSTSSRIAVEMLKSMAGVQMVYVPYKSNPQAVSD